MKKTYPLNVEGKNRDRLLDASKHDIRKYVKRERAKPLPEGADFLDFDCKLGASPADAAAVHFAALMTAVDALVGGGAAQFYVEIISKPGHRTARPVTAAGIENAPEAL
ncbi:MAG: DUF6172 family protein [Polaromonas sp.]